MTSIDKLQKAAERGKAKTKDKRWHAAIDRAVRCLTAGEWCVTELQGFTLITTESGETYRVSRCCECKSYSFGRPCAHRAAVRLLERCNEAEAAKPADAFPNAGILVKRERGGVRIDGWMV
jgi:hypothetical protein